MFAEDPRSCSECPDQPPPCEDSAYEAIVALFPAFWDTPDTRGFLCFLTPIERLRLLDDAARLVDDIMAVTPEDFEMYRAWVDQRVADLMETFDASGEEARVFYFNNFLKALWYEYIVE
jgi:hypothetical protein